MFEIKGENYIGTPYGILHTDKPANQVGISDLCEQEGSPETFKYHYVIDTCDASVLIDHGHGITREVCVCFNGLYLKRNA